MDIPYKETPHFQNTQRKHILAVLGKIAALFVIAVFVIYFVFLRSSNPLPPEIKSQVKFTVVYPKTSKEISIKTDSYKYDETQKSLVFQSDYKNKTITLTEQAAPPQAYTSGQANYGAIGVHPYSQFQSKIGPVALTNVYNTEKYYKSEGQIGIVISKGTLVTAHPLDNQKLTDVEWQDFFNNLRTTK